MLVNEREIAGQRQRSLPHTYTTKGDLVQLRVLAKAGEHATEGLSSMIIVRNTPLRSPTAPAPSARSTASR